MGAMLRPHTWSAAAPSRAPSAVYRWDGLVGHCGPCRFSPPAPAGRPVALRVTAGWLGAASNLWQSSKLDSVQASQFALPSASTVLQRNAACWGRHRSGHPLRHASILAQMGRVIKPFKHAYRACVAAIVRWQAQKSTSRRVSTAAGC